MRLYSKEKDTGKVGDCGSIGLRLDERCQATWYQLYLDYT